MRKTRLARGPHFRGVAVGQKRDYGNERGDARTLDVALEALRSISRPQNALSRNGEASRSEMLRRGPSSSFDDGEAFLHFDILP
jgi:hypothetical protein